MKTWKQKKTVCRRLKNGRFAASAKCKTYRRQRIKRGGFFGSLFK